MDTISKLLEVFGGAGRQYISDLLPGGSLSREWTPENARQAAEVAAFEPGLLGSAAAAGLAADDLRQGNYGSAAMNAVGLLPFVPAMGGVTKKIMPYEDYIKLQSPNLPSLDLKVVDFDAFKKKAKEFGEDIGFGQWAYTTPKNETYLLSKETIKKMRGPHDDMQKAIVQEQAVRYANMPENEDMAFSVLDAARRGDVNSVSQETINLVKAIDRGVYGSFNDASAAIEALAAEIRTQELNSLRKKQK